MPKGRDRTASQAYQLGKEIIAGKYGKVHYTHARPPGYSQGMDCSGFITFIFGFHTSLSTAYMITSSVMENADFTRHSYKGVGSLQKGDVLCYMAEPMGHTTFYIGDGKIMHSTSYNGHDGPEYAVAPGGPMTTVFRPNEGWDEVPVKWEKEKKKK